VAYIAALAWGCSRTEKPWVQKIEIDVFEGREVVGWAAPQLVGRLEAVMGRAGFRLLGDGDEVPKGVQPWRVTAAVRIDEPDPTSEMPGSAMVVLSLKQRGAPERFEVDAAEQTKAASNEIEAVQAAAVKALDVSLAEAAAEARASIELEPQRDEVVAKKLSDENRAVQAAAVRILARRRNAVVLPLLLQRLAADDLTQVRRTIGLLVELKDPSSAAPIIEASRGRSPVVQREVVFALAAIGGDEAEAYLDVVATGHDDPLVRASAEKALSELRARATKLKPLPREERP
jgi:HEAT repeat protein